MQWKKRREFLRRGLRLENLESRSLLAGLIGDSPWQNPLDANDLDCDGALSPSDALVAINAINGGASGEFSGHFAPPQLKGELENAAEAFLDADGDGVLSPSDPLTVINAINSNVGLGLGHDSPTVDEPDNTIADAHDLTADAVNGFVRVRGVISGPSDFDYYKIDATKTRLHVMLFSRGSEGLRVAVVDAEDKPISDDAEASIEAGSHRPAKLNLEVEAGTTYYIKVSAVGDDPAAGGPYALAVLNFDELTFTPPPDSPPGEDHHDDSPDDATEHHRDPAAVVINHSGTTDDEEADAVEIEAKAGKLIVAADAEFDLNVTITEGGELLKEFSTADRHAVVVNVSEGKYTVSVAPSNEEDEGAYHLHVVNVALPIGNDHQPPDHPGPPTVEDILAKLDDDGDGLISETEFPGGDTRIADRIFASWDEDGDGKLSEEEITAGLSTFPPLFPTPPNHDPPAGLIARVRGLRLDAG